MMSVGINHMTLGTMIAPGATAGATVSGAYLAGVVEFALTRGLSRTAVLQQSALRERDLVTLDARFPADVLVHMLRSCASATGDAAFALHFGQYVPCEQVSLAAPLARAAANVTEALELVNRYVALGIDFPSCHDRARYAFRTDHHGLWLSDQRPPDDWPEITEVVFSRFVHGIRRLQQSDVVRALHVRHDAPAHHTAYANVFGVPVHFGSEHNALLLCPSYLHTPLPGAPRMVTRVLETHAQAQLAELTAQRTCRGRLEAELRTALPLGRVGVAQLTKRLAMSRQTLYRRLKAEGVTYEQVLDALRREMAEAALAASDVTIADVARQVGFGDPAAFSRAYKRWTGTSPRAVRRRG